MAPKIESDVPPSPTLMVAFGTLALAANLVFFRLLARFRHQAVNLASTWECSNNDLINNCGVLLAAALAWWFASPWPDIAIGRALKSASHPSLSRSISYFRL